MTLISDIFLNIFYLYRKKIKMTGLQQATNLVSTKFCQQTNGFVYLLHDLFQDQEFGFSAIWLKRFLHKLCYKTVQFSR